MVVNLLETMVVRVGNAEYRRANKSYGLTTLESRPVELDDTRKRFRFKGKSGQEVDLGVREQRLARWGKHCRSP